jgi:hypothetical protein
MALIISVFKKSLCHLAFTGARLFVSCSNTLLYISCFS